MNQREENKLFDFFSFSHVWEICVICRRGRYHLQLVHTLVHSTRATAAATSSHTQPNPVSHISIKQKSFFKKTELLTPFEKISRGAPGTHFYHVQSWCRFFKKWKCDRVRENGKLHVLLFPHYQRKEEQKEREGPFVITLPGRRGDLIDSFSAMHACISQTLPGKSLPAW